MFLFILFFFYFLFFSVFNSHPFTIKQPPTTHTHISIDISIYSFFIYFIGDTPLIKAAKFNHPEVATLLLANGANPLRCNFENRNYYFYLSSPSLSPSPSSSPSLPSSLPLSPSLSPPSFANTAPTLSCPTHLSPAPPRSYNRPLSQDFTKGKGVERKGMSIWEGAMKGNLEVVRGYVERGGGEEGGKGVDVRRKEGVWGGEGVVRRRIEGWWTPLHYAAKYFFIFFLFFLCLFLYFCILYFYLSIFIYFPLPFHPSLPLLPPSPSHRAGKINIIKYLLEKGANPNTLSSPPLSLSLGHSPLSLAMMREGREGREIVKTLIEGGGNPFFGNWEKLGRYFGGGGGGERRRGGLELRDLGVGGGVKVEEGGYLKRVCCFILFLFIYFIYLFYLFIFLYFLNFFIFSFLFFFPPSFLTSSPRKFYPFSKISSPSPPLLLPPPSSSPPNLTSPLLEENYI